MFELPLAASEGKLLLKTSRYYCQLIVESNYRRYIQRTGWNPRYMVGRSPDFWCTSLSLDLFPRSRTKIISTVEAKKKRQTFEDPYDYDYWRSDLVIAYVLVLACRVWGSLWSGETIDVGRFDRWPIYIEKWRQIEVVNKIEDLMWSWFFCLKDQMEGGGESSSETLRWIEIKKATPVTLTLLIKYMHVRNSQRRIDI